jgi:O-antigen/teichoic acid export membrane protein
VLLRAAVTLHQRHVLRRHGLVGASTASPSPGDSFLREGAWYALMAPAALAMSGFDRFLVAWIGGLGPAALAVLLAPQEIALRAIVIPASIVPALLVRVAGGDASDPVLRRLHRWLAPAVFTACAAASACAPYWVPRLFAGIDPEMATAVTQALAVGIFSNAMAQFPLTALLGRGLVKEVALLHWAELPLFVLALLLLLPALGVAGAAWAWSGRIVVDTIAMTLVARRRCVLPPLRLQTAHLGGVALLAGLAAWA